MRYSVQFSYRGTDFHGSQSQPNAITVQEVMEKTFSTIMGLPVALTFAGRTDAGVHAKEMFAHFDWEGEMDAPHLVLRLNSLLPPSIAVRAIVQVADDWHARFSATERAYEYHLTQRKDPFLEGRALRISGELDFDAMNRAAEILLQVKDFASFCKVHTDVKTTLCDVRYAHWDRRGDEWVFTIRADRFLRGMVRAVVGTLLEVGRGRMSETQFAEVLEKHHRMAAGQAAPPEGLYLTQVRYE